MEIIHLSYPIKKELTRTHVVLALEFFGGVHTGHQKLIKRTQEVAKKKNLPLVVLTFDRHPKEIYLGRADFEYLDNLPEKAKKMKRLGVNYPAVALFTKGFSELSPQGFVGQVIMKLKADAVIARFDYTYKPKDIANMENLLYFAKNRFEIAILPEQTSGGYKIGSTTIRQAIRNENLELATNLLGSYCIMSGIVGHGLHNGHKLSFPTVSLVLDDRKVIPKIRVYATRTLVHGGWYDSMTGVSYNVTIQTGKKIYIGSHLFDFDEDTYDEEISIEWYHYTGGEIKFSSLGELEEQLIKDEKEIREYFKNIKDQVTSSFSA